MKWKTKMMSLDMVFLVNIEHKLEKMALQGWMLHEVRNYSMIFRECEPQSLHFNILINPDNSKEKTSVGPVGELETLCVEDGWDFLLRRGMFVIFTNNHEEPIEIHTDPLIKIEMVTKQIRRYLKREIIVLLVFIPIMIVFFASLKEKYVYSSMWVYSIICSILLLAELFFNNIPILIWWSKNRRKTQNPLFSLSDAIYSGSSIAFLTFRALSMTVLMFRSILQPIPGLNIDFLYIPLILISPMFLIMLWKRESENKPKITNEVFGLICLVILVLGFQAIGGVTLFTGDIFSGKQAIRTSDLTNIATPYYPLDNYTEIGLFAMKTVDASDSFEQDTLRTIIVRFYSNSKAESYWNNRKKNVLASETIDKTWGVKGFYFNERKGILLRKGNEIIEISSFMDMSNPDVMQRVKARLGLTK